MGLLSVSVVTNIIEDPFLIPLLIYTQVLGLNLNLRKYYNALQIQKAPDLPVLLRYGSSDIRLNSAASDVINDIGMGQDLSHILCEQAQQLILDRRQMKHQETVSLCERQMLLGM